jgi:hypothetical protein
VAGRRRRYGDLLGSCLRVGLAVPQAYPLPHRLNGGQPQVGALHDPWGLGDHLARRYGARGDAPLDHRGTAPSLLGRVGAREPVVPLGAMRESGVIADTRPAVRPPGLARPRPRAQAMEGGRKGPVAADVGELPDDLKHRALGGPALLPRRLAPHA